MLLVDARAGISHIHGIGLIAHEFIPKGTCLWTLRPDFDVLLTEEQIQALPPAAQHQARRYSFYDSSLNCYILASDDSRFCNHSDDPNMLDDDKREDNFAARDIYPGEELTWDYRPWCGVEFLGAS
jgi:SET domain-containing protein